MRVRKTWKVRTANHTITVSAFGATTAGIKVWQMGHTPVSATAPDGTIVAFRHRQFADIRQRTT